MLLRSSVAILENATKPPRFLISIIQGLPRYSSPTSSTDHALNHLFVILEDLLQISQLSMVPSTSPHPDLQILRTKLNDILRSISAFGPGTSRPPVIDASVELTGEATDDITTQQEALLGLRALRDAVQRDLDVLEKVWYYNLLSSIPSHPRIPFPPPQKWE